MAAYNPAVVSKIISDAVAAAGRGAQSRLALDVGVTAQTVNKWVNGHVVPEPERWPAIEAALGLEPGVLARGSGFGRQAGGLRLVDNGSELEDAEHDEYLQALRARVSTAAEQLSWRDLRILYAVAGWLFHLERAAARHGIDNPGLEGLEDFLAEWDSMGDDAVLNDLARARADDAVVRIAARVRPKASRPRITQVPRRSRAAGLAAKSGVIAEAAEVEAAAKTTRKHPSRPKPPAEDD